MHSLLLIGRLEPRTRLMLGTIIYAVIFLALHDLAAFWARGSAYSVWFPAAGLRLAYLAYFGPIATIPAALAELGAQIGAGRVGVQSLRDVLFALSIVTPPLSLRLYLLSHHASHEEVTRALHRK